MFRCPSIIECHIKITRLAQWYPQILRKAITGDKRDVHPNALAPQRFSARSPDLEISSLVQNSLILGNFGGLICKLEDTLQSSRSNWWVTSDCHPSWHLRSSKRQMNYHCPYNSQWLCAHQISFCEGFNASGIFPVNGKSMHSSKPNMQERIL